MIGSSKLSSVSSSAFRGSPGSIGSTGAIGAQTPPVGKSGGIDALSALSQNPIIRSLAGESGFDGVGKSGSAQKVGAQDGTKQAGLQQLVDTLKQLVKVLETLTGQKAGEAGKGGEAEQAGEAEAAGGAQG
ncbi:hypothetical protein, partial [Corallococcus llansteffanensis]